MTSSSRRSSKRSTRALFVGRFQPFHKGHLAMVKVILGEYDHVLVGVGSAQYSHTAENPFTFAERFEMISRALDAEEVRNHTIVAIPDIGVHSQWVSHVKSLVPEFDAVFTNDPLTKRLFVEAGIKVEERPLFKRDLYSGTEVRRRILAGEEWRDLIPKEVFEFIQEIDGASRIREIGGS